MEQIPLPEWIPFIYINIHFALEWCVDSEKGFMHFFLIKRPGYQQTPQIYIKKSDNSISAIIILFILPIYN